MDNANNIGSGFARSGSSPGASNDSFVCSGSSPQLRSVCLASSRIASCNAFFIQKLLVANLAQECA